MTPNHERDRTLATRADMGEGFAQFCAEMAQFRAEVNRRFDGLYRIGYAVLFVVMTTCAAIVAAVVKFLFFGI